MSTPNHVMVFNGSSFLLKEIHNVEDPLPFTFYHTECYSFFPFFIVTDRFFFIVVCFGFLVLKNHSS